MKEIDFSPSDLKNWSKISYDENELGGLLGWIETNYRHANQLAYEQKIAIFKGVVFEKNDLKKILDQVRGLKTCTYLSFSHLLIPDQSGKQHSTLLAIGEDNGNSPFDLPGDEKFVGIPIEIDFREAETSNATIHLGKFVPTYIWTITPPKERIIQTWIDGLSTQSSFAKNVDMLIKVRFHETDCQSWFDPQTSQGEWVAFFPVIYHCNVERPNDLTADKDGFYCTLMAYEIPKGGIPDPQKSEHSFQVSRDAWRPNWPGGGGGKLGEMVERLIELLSQIDPSVSKLEKLLKINRH